jgi:hypothetical protein
MAAIRLEGNRQELAFDIMLYGLDSKMTKDYTEVYGDKAKIMRIAKKNKAKVILELDMIVDYNL